MLREGLEAKIIDSINSNPKDNDKHEKKKL